MTLKESESVLASDRYWKTIDLKLKRLQCMLCKTEKGILPSLQKSSSALFLGYPLPHALDVYCSVSADGVGQGLSGSVGADDVETLSPSHVGQPTPCWRHSPHLPNWQLRHRHPHTGGEWKLGRWWPATFSLLWNMAPYPHCAREQGRPGGMHTFLHIKIVAWVQLDIYERTVSDCIDSCDITCID